MPWPSERLHRSKVAALRTAKVPARHGSATRRRSRRLAFEEWLAKIDPTAPDRLIPGFANDPSLELCRRGRGPPYQQKGRGSLKRAARRRAATQGRYCHRYGLRLAAARDLDQIEQLDNELTRLKGRDRPAAPLWISPSQPGELIGPSRSIIATASASKPFILRKRSSTSRPRYPGKTKELAWLPHTTTDRHGKVDLNEVLGKDMGCVAYAAAEFYSTSARAGGRSAMGTARADESSGSMEIRWPVTGCTILATPSINTNRMLRCNPGAM